MIGLRDIDEGDRQRLLTWRNLPSVAEYMYSDHEITPEEHDQWFDTTRHRDDRRYWIIELDGAPVGLANLVDIDLDARRCTWAFYLADDSTRGRGVGSWVEYNVLEFVFETLGLEKLYCEVLSTNGAVVAMHESFGFRREAYHRSHVWKAGLPQDVVGLGILRSEWESLRPAVQQRLTDKGVL